MAAASRSPKKLALLIGNNNYEDEVQLKCCINDAQDVGHELEKIGFQVTIATDLSYMKMVQTILQFQRQIDKNDLVVFYYSGHGAQWEDQNYLIAIDNKCLSDDPEMHRHHAVRAQFTLESMAKRRPCAMVFLLDCCRNYLIENQALSSTPLAKSARENTISTGLAPMKGVAGSLIAFACGPNEIALENSKNGRNSVFTYHLLKHIAEPNLKIDEMMCRVCNGMFEDSDGQSCSYRLSSLRTPNVYFNAVQKDNLDLQVLNSKFQRTQNFPERKITIEDSTFDLPACVLLSSYRNPKLEDRIDGQTCRSSVDLRCENLTDEDMEIVVEHAIFKKQCTRLYLEKTNITSSGVSIIASALRNNTTVDTLNLSNNRVSDMGAHSLSENLSGGNSILKVLGLGSNGITDLGAQHLAEMLKTNRALTFLGLSSNEIGDQGVRLLANVLTEHNVSLQELYLDGNKLISDWSVDYLIGMFKRNRSLKTLRIANCNLSEKGKRRLQRSVRWKFFFSIQV